MDMKTDPAAVVLAAAKKIESRGETASIRKVIAEIGYGSPNYIGPLLKKRRAPATEEQQPVVELDPAMIEAIKRQLARTAAEVKAAAESLINAAEDNATLLANSCQELEERLVAVQAELDSTKGVVRQQAGQLEERTRELENVRSDTAAAIAELRSMANGERQIAEDLRQQLVKAKLRLESLPRLEKALEEHQQLLAHANEAVAAARQEAAVATAGEIAQEARAEEAAAREGALRKDAAHAQAELARAWEGERRLRMEVQQLSQRAAVAEGRCAVLEAQSPKVVPEQMKTDATLADS